MSFVMQVRDLQLPCPTCDVVPGGEPQCVLQLLHLTTQLLNLGGIVSCMPLLLLVPELTIRQEGSNALLRQLALQQDNTAQSCLCFAVLDYQRGEHDRLASSILACE